MKAKTHYLRVVLVMVILALLLSVSGCARRADSRSPADPAADNGPTNTIAAATIAATETPKSVPTSTTAGVSPLPTATAPSSPLPTQRDTTEPIYTYEIVADYPHDPLAWTQGLVYTNSVLYEGTGLRGHSTLRKTDLESGDILQGVSLPEEFFGEGVTVFDDKVYQLTWQEHQGFIYNEDDLSELSTFGYATEGWGLTHDGKQLIMSDGTATLYFRDPETLKETGRILVTSSHGSLSALNELEYVNGEIYANVWTTDWIARIDPATGKVVGWINLTGLLSPEYREGGQANVLNGIAYDTENDRLFVTGKFWPRLFEITLIPKE